MALYVSSACVCGRLCQLVVRLVHVRSYFLVSNYNINSELLQTTGLLTNTGFVHKHCVSVYLPSAF